MIEIPTIIGLAYPGGRLPCERLGNWIRLPRETNMGVAQAFTSLSKATSILDISSPVSTPGDGGREGASFHHLQTISETKGDFRAFKDKPIWSSVLLGYKAENTSRTHGNHDLNTHDYRVT